MEHVQRKMTQMVKEYETKFYEKQLRGSKEIQPKEEIDQTELQRPQISNTGSDTAQARD